MEYRSRVFVRDCTRTVIYELFRTELSRAVHFTSASVYLEAILVQRSCKEGHIDIAQVDPHRAPAQPGTSEMSPDRSLANSATAHFQSSKYIVTMLCSIAPRRPPSAHVRPIGSDRKGKEL